MKNLAQSPHFDEFFKGFKLNSQTFADYHYLTPEFRPSNLVDRENQTDKIWNNLLYAITHNSIPPNFFLYGLPGTGKTAAIDFILQRLSIYSNQNREPNFIAIYNNCALNNTPYRILFEICNRLEIRLPQTGISTEAVYARFMEATSHTSPLQIILFLDELDFLFVKRKTGNDLLYKFTRFPSSLKNPIKISILGITNDLNLKDSFDSRVWSSLSPEEIYFAPYSVSQLQAILYQRSKAFKPNVLQNGVIELIAAHFTRNGDGDARRSIAVLRTAGEITDKEGASEVTVAHAKLALKKYTDIAKDEIIQTLPSQSKKILLAIQNTQKKYAAPVTGLIYSEYMQICQGLKTPILGLRQFNNHVKNLEKLNLINTESLHRGKSGNTRKITYYFS